MITQELLHHYFDYKNGHLYWKNVVHLNQSHLIGEKAGFIHSTGYRHITFMNKQHKAHRLIWMYVYGKIPKEIDHINGNREDNHLENLRSVTRSQNQFNKIKSSNNTSGYRGVSWHNKSNCWVARVCANGKSMIRYVKNLELAGLVAEEMRDLMYGEYAIERRLQAKV